MVFYRKKELEKYAYKHPKSVSNLLENALDDGREIFAENKGFTGHSGRKISDLTAKGKRRTCRGNGTEEVSGRFFADIRKRNQRNHYLAEIIWSMPHCLA